MPKEPCPSEFGLTLWYTCELPPDEQATLSRHIAACDACQSRVVELDAASEPTLSLLLHFTAEAPPSSSSTESSSQDHSTTNTGWWGGLQKWRQWLDGLGGQMTATAGIALVAFVLFYQPPPQSAPAAPHTRRTTKVKRFAVPRHNPVGTSKGRPLLKMLFHRKGTRTTRWAKQRQILHPGTLIQFVVNLKQSKHFMVVSVDRKRKISQILPFDRKVSTTLASGMQSLPEKESLELDKTLGPEMFVLFLANTPIHFRVAKAALQKALAKERQTLPTSVSVPGFWQVRSLLIIKRKR